MNVKDIIAEIKDDNAQIQEIAFNLYCKHTLKLALERYQTDMTRLTRSQEQLEAYTEESLRKTFEDYGYETMSTKKEEWVKRATEQFNTK